MVVQPWGKAEPAKNAYIITQKELAGDATHVSRLTRQNLGVWFESSAFLSTITNVNIGYRSVGYRLVGKGLYKCEH